MNINVAKASLKHLIAEEVRKAIFEGKFGPGDKITESQLAKDLGVSRGPVREAFQLLELEGLLISSPYKETRVSSISQEEVLELLIPMRVNIETFALKKAFPLWNEDTFSEFQLIMDGLTKSAMYNDMSSFIEWDIQFHQLIITSSEIDNLIKIWESIVSRIRLHFICQNTKSAKLDKFLAEHQALFDAFKKGNVEEALAALEDHIVNTNIPDVYLL